MREAPVAPPPSAAPCPPRPQPPARQTVADTPSRVVYPTQEPPDSYPGRRPVDGGGRRRKGRDAASAEAGLTGRPAPSDESCHRAAHSVRVRQRYPVLLGMPCPPGPDRGPRGPRLLHPDNPLPPAGGESLSGPCGHPRVVKVLGPPSKHGGGCRVTTERTRERRSQRPGYSSREQALALPRL